MSLSYLLNKGLDYIKAQPLTNTAKMYLVDPKTLTTNQRMVSLLEIKVKEK